MRVILHHGRNCHTDWAGGPLTNEVYILRLGQIFDMNITYRHPYPHVAKYYFPLLFSCIICFNYPC